MPDDDKKREQQAKADANRRSQHFQVRLDKQLAQQLQHYADQRHNGIINSAPVSYTHLTLPTKA